MDNMENSREVKGSHCYVRFIKRHHSVRDVYVVR